MKKYVYFKIYIGKPVFNFGYVLEGTFMVHKFRVQNKGGKPLHIKKIRTTCACTNAPIKDKNCFSIVLDIFIGSPKLLLFHRMIQERLPKRLPLLLIWTPRDQELLRLTHG